MHDALLKRMPAQQWIYHL